MLRKIAFSLGFILILVCVGAAYVYHEQPDVRMQVQVMLKSFKIRAGTEKLIADHICSDELRKADCFANFVKLMGGIEFSTDLAFFSVASYKICYSNTSCILANNEKIMTELQMNKLWIYEHLQIDRSLFSGVLQVEKKIIDKYLRSTREIIGKQFQAEVDEEKKSILLIQAKEVDAKIVEVAQAQ